MRKLILATLAAVVVSLAVLAPGSANDASAGSNGQQLEVYQCYASSIKIVGKNQNNVTTTYTISNSSKTGCSTHKTTNWWWKGSVVLTSTLGNGSKFTKTVTVPVSQASNWYKVNMTFPPAPNGVSPWLYSESWKLTKSYNTSGHCDYWNLTTQPTTCPSSGTHLNQKHAVDFAAGCNKKVWPTWDGMTLKKRVDSNGEVWMDKTISGVKYRLVYFHLNSIYYSVGQTVNTYGKELGLAGSKGLSSGCHLHMFVLRYQAASGCSDNIYSTSTCWYNVEPKFCGRTYPPASVGNWFKGC